MQEPKETKQPLSNVTPMQNEYTAEQVMKKQIASSNRKKRRLRLGLIIAFGTSLIFPFAYNTVNNVMKINALEDSIAVAQEETMTAKEEQQELKVEVGLLQDDEYVAKLARSRYYLSKDGEIIFSLPEDNDSKTAEQEIEGESGQ